MRKKKYMIYITLILFFLITGCNANISNNDKSFESSELNKQVNTEIKNWRGMITKIEQNKINNKNSKIYWEDPMNELGGSFAVTNSQIEKYNLQSGEFVEMTVEVSQNGCSIKNINKLDFRNVTGVIKKIKKNENELLITLKAIEEDINSNIQVVTSSTTKYNKTIEDALKEKDVIEVLGIYNEGKLYTEVITLKESK